MCSQIVDHTVHVVSLIPAERDVLSIRKTAPREVEAEKCYVRWQKVLHTLQRFESTRAISMHVNYARHFFPLPISLEGFEVAAHYILSPLVGQSDISPDHSHTSHFEFGWAQIFDLVIRSGWPDDCFPKRTVACKFHFLN